MKWIIDGKEFTSVEDAAEYISEQITEDEYDDMLDSCYDEVQICGYEYAPSDALYRIDPIAYRCGFSDYQNGCIENIQYELDMLDDQEETEIYGCTASFIEEEEEEEE